MSIFYTKEKETCPTCKATVAAYLLEQNDEGNYVCPCCKKSPPLVSKSPPVGANFSAHMTAKRNRLKKRVGRK